MTRDAARMTLALGEEDGLNFAPEKLEVECGAGRRR
jgi:hypothetical protein